MKRFFYSFGLACMITFGFNTAFAKNTGITRQEGIKKVDDHKKMCKKNPDGSCKRLGAYYARCSDKAYNKAHRLECNNKLISCYHNPRARGCFR